MFLKRIELQGFKSFAGKTTLEFPARVTAIVGPNGSGKSNVIDAFRWVLGEREAKQLRGDTLETLIFAGTPKRPAVGMARVSLWFDNHERTFPFESEEIVLARKADRAGTSEFLLQDEEMKLKDLVPMLARAKLGTRGLTMIGQGQSDMVVKATPEERRVMIEEMLGLREFRIKKQNAERQLATSDANRERVRAMYEELEPHLRLLRRQKGRWDRRSEVAQELTALENIYFGFHYHVLENQLRAVENPLKEKEELVKQKELHIRAAEADFKRTNEGVKTHKTEDSYKEITALLNERSLLEREYARREAKKEWEAQKRATPNHSQEEYTNLLGLFADDITRARALDRIEAIKELLNAWHERLQKFLGRGQVSIDHLLEEELQETKKKLEKINQQIAACEARDQEARKEEQKRNATFRDQLMALEGQKNELRVHYEEVQRMRFEKEKIIIRIQDLEREWQALGRAIKELHTLPHGEGKELHEDVQKKIFRLRGELAAIGEIDEQVVKETEETEARAEFLTKELTDLESATRDLRNLIRELEERIHHDFKNAFHEINTEFHKYFGLMFPGGKAKLKLKEYEVPKEGEGEAPLSETEQKDNELRAGVEIELSIPRKRITSLEMLSGGEKSLVSMAALFALIAVSPPPFLVLDEMDAALDEENARRFAELIKVFAYKTQFIVVTHNRATMEAADVLYGVTMGDDGVSKILSLKLE